MKENYGKACVEVLEILKYLDGELVSKIPSSTIEELILSQDLNYKFEINKNIPIYDNMFLEETILILKNLDLI